MGIISCEKKFALNILGVLFLADVGQKKILWENENFYFHAQLIH